MKGSPFEWASLLFNGIIAIVAVTGFLYTVFSNRQVSETLKTITNTFETYSDPIFQFEGFDWIYRGKLRKISCENLPYGIAYRYKNISNFPIKLSNMESKIMFEDVVLADKDNTDMVNAKSETVLAANSNFGYTVVAKDEIDAMFRKHSDIYRPPFLELHFSAIISNLSETKKYKIELVDYIGISCKNLPVQNIINHKTLISRISEIQ